MFSWHALEPDGLPDTAARRVPDHAAAVQGLLPNGNLRAAHICRIKNVDNTGAVGLALLVGPVSSSRTVHSARSH